MVEGWGTSQIQKNRNQKQYSLFLIPILYKISKKLLLILHPFNKLLNSRLLAIH